MQNIHKTPTGAIITGFPSRAKNILPSDSIVYPSGVMVYVGSGGDVEVEPLEGGNTVVFTLPAGGVVPVTCRRVLESTTAGSLVGVF